MIDQCGWKTYFFNLTCTFLELQLVFYNAEFCKPGSGIWSEYFSVRVFLSVLPFYRGCTIRQLSEYRCRKYRRKTVLNSANIVIANPGIYIFTEIYNIKFGFCSVAPPIQLYHHWCDDLSIGLLIFGFVTDDEQIFECNG